MTTTTSRVAPRLGAGTHNVLPLGSEPAACPDPRGVCAPESPADRRVKIINLGAVLVPFAGLIVAILLSWGAALDWVQVGIALGMGLATALGITVGYHRLFTHQSFRTSATVRLLLAGLGSMAVQGPVIEWAGTHRRHHQHSDDESDPHSPHRHAGGAWGTGLRATLRGLVHAHLGWLFAGHPKGLGKYTKDLRADPVLCAVNRSFPLLVLLGLVIPAVLGGVLTLSLRGALLGLLWGGLVRVMVVHHITWSVNSVCHLWGTQPFRSGDHSRNNVVVGVLGLGEGWHNNHHAFPTSARHGLRWWQLDLTFMVIRTLGWVGLVHGIRVPAADRQRAKRR
jgi:stearoyl-CoA desaturase (delta-9 desaturase)